MIGSARWASESSFLTEYGKNVNQNPEKQQHLFQCDFKIYSNHYFWTAKVTRLDWMMKSTAVTKDRRSNFSIIKTMLLIWTVWFCSDHPRVGTWSAHLQKKDDCEDSHRNYPARKRTHAKPLHYLHRILEIQNRILITIKLFDRCCRIVSIYSDFLFNMAEKIGMASNLTRDGPNLPPVFLGSAQCARQCETWNMATQMHTPRKATTQSYNRIRD